MKKLFTMLTIIIMLFGCGVDDNDDDSCGSTVPVITKVVFYERDCTDPDIDIFNPEHQSVFNVDDTFDVIIYATDCDLNMDILYSGLGDYDLPPQTGVDRGYHFANCFIMDIQAGVYVFEFQIEDQNGHLSNTLPVTITVK